MEGVTTLGTSAELITVTNEGRVVYQCGDYRLVPGVPQQVPQDFIGQFGSLHDLRFNWAELGDFLATRTPDGAPVLDLIGPISRNDGYGRHFLDLFRGMEMLGVSANLRRTPRFQVDEKYLNPAVLAMTEGNRDRLPSRVAVSFTLPYDETIWNNRSLVRIVLTQFETTRMPAFHVGYINKTDHLIVTSSYQVEVCRNSGVTVPISVMTPGVDTDFFTQKPARTDQLFKVLILGALTGRKNPLGAIDIFKQASNGDPTWRLTIKSRNADGIDVVQEKAGGDSRIRVVVEDTHPDEVLHYYHYHDCLLWPSKGEGVGLPPLEALSCGLEVVCSFNSGMMDFLDEDWSWPIRTERLEPAGWPNNLHGFSRDYVENYGDVGSWWVPEAGHAVTQLRAAHAAWKQGNGKGPRAAASVRAGHTLRHQARSVLSVAERYLD